MQIPVGMIATIQFTPFDASGTWAYAVSLYDRADYLDCALVAVRPVVDL